MSKRGRKNAGLILTGIAVLLAQMALVFWLTPKEVIPMLDPLSGFPSTIGRWHRLYDTPLSKDAQQMLQPSDYLDRTYTDGSNSVNLFIAYYVSQRLATSAHDPKVCLPGAGWDAVSSRVVSMRAGDRSISVNAYLVTKDAAQAVVVYWYQTHDGVFTYEQEFHLDRVLKLIGQGRTDIALVRIVNAVEGNNKEGAQAAALTFGDVIYPEIARHFAATSTVSKP